MEFEKERFAKIQGTKRLRGARLPEVDFVGSRLSREENEPAVVCATDKGFHGFPADLILLILGAKTPF
jgi:hypothetical protein